MSNMADVICKPLGSLRISLMSEMRIILVLWVSCVFCLSSPRVLSFQCSQYFWIFCSCQLLRVSQTGSFVIIRKTKVILAQAQVIFVELTILFKSFHFLARKDLYIICLSNIFDLTLYDEKYSRNTQKALNVIFICFINFFHSIQ